MCVEVVLHILEEAHQVCWGNPLDQHPGHSQAPAKVRLLGSDPFLQAGPCWTLRVQQGPATRMI